MKRTALILTLAALLATGTPATADGSYSGRPYIWGSGTLTEDWDDEGVVNVSTHRVSNVTCLWQLILTADGYLELSDVDGVFGDRTHAATVRWQRDRGLTADGSAGRQTWAKAGDRLRDTGAEADGWRYGYYAGTEASKTVRRSGAGNYQFWDSAGAYRPAAYDTRSCS